MRVYLHRFRETDSKETVRSGTDVVPGLDEEEYFDVEDLELDEWERVERDGQVLQRNAVEYDEVAALSVPGESGGDLPGETLQLRMAGGETEYVEDAVLVEAQDADP